MGDYFERVLKIGIWIVATTLFGWTWYTLLSYQSYVTGLGFNSLLLLATLIFFYYLKQLLHLEFNVSKAIESGSTIIQTPKRSDRQ